MSASVLIALDTTPPVISVEAPLRVDPVEPWEVVFRSSEPLGSLDVVLVDSLGGRWEIGWTLTDEQTAVALIGTTGIPHGPVVLEIAARDLAGNVAQTVVEASLWRLDPYEIDLVITGRAQVQTGRQERYRVESIHQRRYITRLEVTGG